MISAPMNDKTMIVQILLYEEEVVGASEEVEDVVVDFTAIEMSKMTIQMDLMKIVDMVSVEDQVVVDIIEEIVTLMTMKEVKMDSMNVEADVKILTGHHVVKESKVN